MLTRAVTMCPLNHRPIEEQQARLEELLRIEAEERVPGFARGILLAAACRESAYKLRPACGDAGASCGVLQLSGHHRRRLRSMGAVGDDPRSDWRAAARYWLRHLKRQLPRVAACEGRGGYATRAEMLWASANKTATWRAKCAKRKCTRRAHTGACVRSVCVKLAPRCSRRQQGWETKHWRLLRAWHGR